MPRRGRFRGGFAASDYHNAARRFGHERSQGERSGGPLRSAPKSCASKVSPPSRTAVLPGGPWLWRTWRLAHRLQLRLTLPPFSPDVRGQDNSYCGLKHLGRDRNCALWRHDLVPDIVRNRCIPITRAIRSSQMSRLEDLTPNASLRGILPNALATANGNTGWFPSS